MDPAPPLPGRRGSGTNVSLKNGTGPVTEPEQSPVLVYGSGPEPAIIYYLVASKPEAGVVHDVVLPERHRHVVPAVAALGRDVPEGLPGKISSYWGPV